MRFVKLICLVLALCMLGGVLASCGSEKQDPAETKTQPSGESQTNPGDAKESETEGSSYVPTDLPIEDFGDEEFLILSSDRGLFVTCETKDWTGDLIEDALFKNTSMIEETYKVSIVYEEAGSDATMAKTLETAVSGGESAYSMSIGHDYLTLTNALKGYYLDLAPMEEFEFEKPWWPENNVKALTIHDRLFCASSFLSYTALSYTRMVTVNKTIADDLSIEIPYAQVKRGDWYYEDLIDLASRAYNDANGNGEFEEGDRMGIIMGNQSAYTLQRAADVQPILKDSDDTPYYELDLGRALEFVSAFEELFENGVIFDGKNPQFETNGHIEFFASGNSLFCIMELKDVYKTLRGYRDIVYGYLSTPKLDEQQKKYINGCTDCYWGIPSTAQAKQHMIATIIELLSCENYNYVLPAFYESTMQAKLSESPDDKEMLDIIRDTVALSFAYSYSGALGGIDVSLAQVTNATSGTLASYIETNGSKLETSLTELVQKFDSLD